MAKHKSKGIFNEYRGALRKEIQAYCRGAGIAYEDFHFLSVHKWEGVYEKLLANFADHGWAAANGLHWLNTNGVFSKEVYHSFDSRGREEWILKLPELLDKSEKMIYYAVEDSDGKFWIAEGSPETVAELIYEDMYASDYYITDRKFRWMITRNHHGIVLFIGEELRYTEVL